MSTLIQRPNATAALQAEVNRLTADVSVLTAQLAQCHAAAEEQAVIQAQLEAELTCPDCDEPGVIAKLECEADSANYDVLKIQGLLRNELCGNHWRTLFKKCDQSAAYAKLGQMFSALLVDKEYTLTVAQHNAQFCKAQGAAECVEMVAEELDQILVDNPTMEARCKGYINTLLTIARG